MDISRYTRLIEEKISSLGYDRARPASLFAPIGYGLEAGGKRLRPVLALLACESFGGAAEDVLDAAVGIEMFHNFTLLHDDVMDNSDTRRGRPTVHCKWDANTAILSGDAMLTLATEMVTRVPDSILRPVVGAFNSDAMEVYIGQALDMDFETRSDVTVEEYVEMIRKKTGALLACACRVGALAGGAAPEEDQALYDYGMTLGVAFQIWDDYLDVYGDPETFGKPIGGDILNDKKTFLQLSVLNNPDPAIREEALRIMRSMQGREKIDAMRALYDRAGVADLCRSLVAEETDKALRFLEKTSMGAEWRRKFAEIAAMLVNRKK